MLFAPAGCTKHTIFSFSNSCHSVLYQTTDPVSNAQILTQTQLSYVIHKVKAGRGCHTFCQLIVHNITRKVCILKFPFTFKLNQTLIDLVLECSCENLFNTHIT